MKVLKDDSLLQQGYLGLVKEKGKWGIVGTNGQVVLAPAYKSLDASSKRMVRSLLRKVKIKFLTLKAMVLY